MANRLALGKTHPATTQFAGDGFSIPIEWPPILFVLDSDDAHATDFADACRDLAELGFCIQSVVRRDLVDLNAKREEIGVSANFRSFFSKHLVDHFPKML